MVGIVTGRTRANIAPRWPFALDWSHPLSRGLQALYIPGYAGDPTLVEMITGARGALVNQATIAPVPRGTILDCDGVDDYVSYSDHLPGVGGSTYTIAVYAPTVGAQDTHGHVMWGSNTVTTPTLQVAPLTSNRITLGAANVEYVGVDNWFNGSDRSVVGVSTAGAPSAYLNGLPVGTSTEGTAPTITTAAKAVHVGRWIGGTSWDFNGEMLVLALSTSAWGAGEAALFHAAPLSLLAEYGRRTWFLPTAAAPSGSALLLRLHAEGLTTRAAA